MKTLRKAILAFAATAVMFGGTVAACAPAKADAPLWVYEKWFQCKIHDDNVGAAFWGWVLDNWD